MLKIWAGALACVAAGTGVAVAKESFSDEWDAYAKETQADCDRFRETLPSSDRPTPALVERDDPPRLRGPLRPHACVFLRFDLDAAGKPANVELMHKAPENLRYTFVRAAMQDVKGMRFELPDAFADDYKSMAAELIYRPCTGKHWTYCYSINFFPVAEP